MSNHIGTHMSDPEVFRYWSELAVQDPERFERERRACIEKAVSTAPESIQERLRRLQWRIDIERARAKNPLSACIRLNQMMLDFVYVENGFVDTLQRITASVQKKQTKEAHILLFIKKK